ncbi:MFS transporter [Amycolatopsis sp. SB7-3]|uniref:MFS transporter n=1 Tax=Amycolatopsis sp. SB7-3 TaxID=3373438 RepID=UPI003741F80F
MLVPPLALAQFVASYAATTMTVAVSVLAADLGTTVLGVQTAITLFTLTMAALMVPGGKLTDVLGRKRCFVAGLGVYGAGALLVSVAHGPVALVLGYSLLQGIGSALMIPPIYILVTVASPDVETRARRFGVISGAGALGAAAGPLLGGLITTWLGWRASFLLQVLLVGVIVLLALRIAEPMETPARAPFDVGGAVLSAAGLFFVVAGVLRPAWLLIGLGAAILVAFHLHIRARERGGREPLVSPALFRDRVTRLGLITQHVQWLILQGSFFVIAVFLQQARGYDAVETGLTLTPATIGILAASAAAGRMARRHAQRRLIRGGFVLAIAGLLLVLLLVRADSGVASAVPGLFLLGAGVGIMLTASVNLVQSRSPDAAQGDISGVSRGVSNLGSSVGTALAGSVLAGAAGHGFAWALATMTAAGVTGLIAAVLLPTR